MSVKKVLLAIISLFLIAAKVFAPAPETLALNHETKQCARYWGGDEFVDYELPSGWKIFQFQYSNDLITAETDIGTCQVAKKELFSLQKACCEQLSYTFLPGNIGVRKLTPQGQAIYLLAWANQYKTGIIIFTILLIMVIALLLHRNKKQ